MLTQLKQLYATILEIMRLPKADLHFESRLNPAAVPATYRQFVAPHPRYKLVSHKTIGVALLCLQDIGNPATYLQTLKRQSNSIQAARRARNLGYTTQRIDRNAYRDQIHAIHTSQPQRQGRPMAEQYLRKTSQYEQEPNVSCYGVLNREGQLQAYCTMGVYGNFAAFSQLMGFRNSDGAMHLLIIDIVCHLLEERHVDYLMYDTYFGAKPGMQRFKSMFGFRPFHVRYSIS